MADLKLSHIYKVYENGHKAVNDFCIDIQDKEFIVFVGPSGCGKSTTLRMIAGLETITAGDLFIGDTLVNDMEPKDRDIAMVFQNYALYPHMTVYENMAFGLRNRHMPEEEIKERVLEAARILDITDYLPRKPKAMSGGQRQRVALGRAIVRNPKVFLLDEPLSNLDAKLRAAMRTEITKLHKRLQTTFIYVTHDQVEAMTMGTRIVVMKLGYVQQIDTPMTLYNKPYNKFVAGFIGTPQMNFFDVKLNREGDIVNVLLPDGSMLPLPYEKVSKIHDSYIHGEKDVIFGIRPEHISIVEEETGVKAVVTAVERLGNESIIYGDLGTSVGEFTMADQGKAVIIKTVQDVTLEPGTIINLKVNENKVHFFDKETEITLMLEVPEYSSFPLKKEGGKLEMLGGNVPVNPVFEAGLADGEYEAEIPPSAIVPGKQFSLKVQEIEEVSGGRRLAYLSYDNRYLFAFVDESVKKGASYSFDVKFDKIAVLKGGEKVMEPIGEKECLTGSFKRVAVNRNYDFYYGLAGADIAAPAANGYKINAVEGDKCYKKTYKYEFERAKIAIAEEGLPASVEEILDYGAKKYARLAVGAEKILIDADEGELAGEVKLAIAGEDIEVWQMESDFRIC